MNEDDCRKCDWVGWFYKGHEQVLYCCLPNEQVCTTREVVNMDEKNQIEDVFSFKWKEYDIAVNSEGMKNKLRQYFDVFGVNQNTVKKVLDVGCGPCRYFEIFPDNTEYVGVDLTDVVNSAVEKYKKFDNFSAFKMDMMKIPESFGRFDLVLAMGTLHHTPDTEKAFKHISSFVSDDGDFCFYIYNKKGLLREYLDDKIRLEVQNWSNEKIKEFSKVMVNVGKELQKVDITIDGLPFQRFIYWNVFKCYTNPLGDDHSEATVFDWYAPKYAFRHTKEEIDGWIKDVGMKVKFYKNTRSGHFYRVGP